MVWQTTPYTPVLVATAVLLVGFAAYLVRPGRRRWLPGMSLGGVLMLVTGGWVAIYTIKLSAATLPTKILLTRVEFVPVLALPIVWLAYVLRYTGRTDWLSWRVFGPLTAIAAGVQVLVLTDGIHHLVYREYEVVQTGSFVAFDPVYGPVFAVFLGFTYTLFGTSLLFLATAAVHARGTFRWQITTLCLFAAVPGVAGILFVFDASPVPGLNVAALSLAVTVIAGVVSFVRFGWTGMTPIARDQILGSMTEAAVVLDAEYRIVDFNSPAKTLFDAADDGLVGTPVSDVLPEIAEQLDECDERDPADTGGRRFEGRAEITRTVDGSRRTIDVCISPIGAGTGSAAGYTLLLHDITTRKAAERQVKKRRRKTERLHRVTRDLTAARTREAVFQRAVDGGHEVLDADVCRLSVAEDGELIPAASSTDKPVGACDSQPVDAGIAGEAYQSGDTIVVDDLADTRSTAAVEAADSDRGLTDGPAPKPDRRCSYRSLLSVPIGDVGVVQALADGPAAFSDSDREALELLATHVETAVERADVESELRTERDRLEEFASVLSHDLRNPLNVAQGRVELLRGEAPTEHVAPIDRSLSRMEDIITDVLTLAREGEAVSDVDAVDLGDCVDDAWETVDTRSAVLRCDDGFETVTADAGRLQRLLENLFRNSVEHGSIDSDSQGVDGSDVTVRVGRLDGEPGFYVVDDGPGIPPDERESIFEHGYSTDPDGTGLGLAIVDRIASAHGWTVTATGADSGGARFEIRTDP